MKYNIVKMEDVLDALIDYRGKTPHKSDKGIMTLSAKSVKNNYIDYSQCYYISEDEYNRFMVRGFPQKGDILLTTEAPLGMVARLDRDDVAIAQRLLTLRGKKNVLDNDYLLYYLQSPIGQASLKARETGTTVTGIKQAEFRKIELKIPDYDIQKKISGILRTIDEKIKINNEISNNLEQQAQAFFMNMFPNIFGSDASQTFQTLITFSNGKKRPTGSGQIPIYGGNGVLAYTNQTNAENCVIIGRVGAYCGNTFLCLSECWASDNAIQAKSKNEKSQLFIYYLLKNAALQSRHIGTGQPLITQGILNSIPVNIPVAQEIAKFINICEPMYKIITANNCENTKLTSLRDTLLPKLMSGDIDVTDIRL